MASEIAIPTPSPGKRAATTLVLVPARMASTRLPGKPLADIAGLPMIVQVWRRACESGVGRVVVATDHADIVAAVEQHGGEAVLTRADHESGSDRIWEALERVDPQGNVESIVNLQGDLPTIPARAISACLDTLHAGEAGIATLCAEITEEAEREDPNVVKAIGTPIGGNRLRALYFTRATAPWGEGPLYHHIGLYAYRRSALKKFVSLPPSVLERRERLEQLRALEAGIGIDIAIIDTVPIGVDTQSDLQAARQLLAGEGKSR